MPTRRITAPERLITAISTILTGITTYVQKCVDSKMRIGYCMIMPIQMGNELITEEELKDIGENIRSLLKEPYDSFYTCYFPNPLGSHIPNLEFSDYTISYGISEFDDSWQRDQLAQGLLYCPSEQELGSWHYRIQEQEEAVRITPFQDSIIRDMVAGKAIDDFLQTDAQNFFKDFVQKYALHDDHIKVFERNRPPERLYSELHDFFSQEQSIHSMYEKSKKLCQKTRDPKVKTLLKAFIEHVEDFRDNIFKKNEAPDPSSIKDLLETKSNKSHTKIPKRPAQGLYYLRLAELLYLFIQELSENAGKKPITGEMIMFIWLCQHIAFDAPGTNLKIQDILRLKTCDIDFEKQGIEVKKKKIVITKGLLFLLKAWIGSKSRKNNRKLFTYLSYDLIEDNLERMRKKLIDFQGTILPKDLLIKAHVIPDLRMTQPLRHKLNLQEVFIFNNPHTKIDEYVKKHVRDTLKKKQLYKPL